MTFFLVSVESRPTIFNTLLRHTQRFTLSLLNHGIVINNSFVILVQDETRGLFRARWTVWASTSTRDHFQRTQRSCPRVHQSEVAKFTFQRSFMIFLPILSRIFSKRFQLNTHSTHYNRKFFYAWSWETNDNRLVCMIYSLIRHVKETPDSNFKKWKLPWGHLPSITAALWSAAVSAASTSVTTAAITAAAWRVVFTTVIFTIVVNAAMKQNKFNGEWNTL